MSLSRIEVITGMSKFSSLKAALSKAGVRGMTVMQVLDQYCCGNGACEFHRRDHQGTAVYRSHRRWKDLYL